MSDASDDLSLAAEFPAATRAQWRALVERMLKGAPFEEKLGTRSYNGLAINPLPERRADAQPIAGRTPGVPWSMMQRIDHPDPTAANAEARHELANGATGLVLVCAGSVGAHGFGLAADAIEQVLDGVALDAGIAIEFDLGPQTRNAPLALAAVIKRRGIDPATVNIRFGFGPLGAAAHAGGLPLPWKELAPPMARHIAGLAAQGFAERLLAADGRIVHAAGGSEAQELGFVLAVATEYLRALEAQGVLLDRARRMLFFRLAADAEQFLTIAKFRALRKLWARVEDACALTPAPAFVAAETAWRMMTRRAPHVNILRATIAAFAAGIGGADAITVLPFTLPLGLPDRAARRVARNTQLILIEESNLAKVADPAAGSGAFEDLTEKLAGAAWTLFQEIERAGGAAAALERGMIQDKIAAVRAEREAAIARRSDAITGTSEFPDLNEAPVSVLDVTPLSASAPPPVIAFPPLQSFRLAEPFEQLRDASDRKLAQTGSRPKIFLANLGTMAEFTPRATFAKNLFEAGGIEAMSNDGFASQADMVAAFQAVASPLACLCGSDAAYARDAAAWVAALHNAGARHLYLVAPPERSPFDARTGIATLIHPACDALGLLQEAARQA